MDGDEMRAVSRVAKPTAAAASPSWPLKLPFLCARPGNVGVQIDSYRAMKLFHRPRCGKFTDHFLGIPFETASMDNYARVVERTSRRARIVEDRLTKLRARQQEIVDDTERRQRRRGEREAARQRKVWLHHQSLKKREQRQREDEAAIVIQRCVRGSLARRERDSRQHDIEQERAARTLQRSSRSFLHRKRDTQRALERQKERQMQAATVLQRQARKRLALASRRHHAKLDALESPRRAASSDVNEAPAVDAVETDEPVPGNEGDPASPEIARAISIDLLFSDSDDDELSALVSPLPPLLAPLDTRLAAATEPARVSPRRPQQPRRPVSIKRVGGGFRATAFTPSKSPVPLTRVTRSQQPIQHTPATRSTGNRATPSPLALVQRRPSVPASPGSSSSFADRRGSRSGGGSGSDRAPMRRRWSSSSSANDASANGLQQQAPAQSDRQKQQEQRATSLLSSSLTDGDGDLALEELLEASTQQQII